MTYHFHCPRCLVQFPSIWALKIHQERCLPKKCVKVLPEGS